MKLPFPERRSRKRILTLKNARWTVVIVLVFFAGLTIRSEMRHGSSNDYGRLFGKQVERERTEPKAKFDVIRETPVADQTAADPLLVAAAAREQYLGVNDASVQPVINASAVTTAQSLDSPRGALAIVGGTDGVSIVRNNGEKRPTLAGGIFRQH